MTSANVTKYRVVDKEHKTVFEFSQHAYCKRSPEWEKLKDLTPSENYTIQAYGLDEEEEDWESEEINLSDFLVESGLKMNHYFTPVIHVKELDTTLKNIDICLEANVNGVFLINHKINFKKFLPIVEKVRNKHNSLWLGVNVLGDIDRSESPLITIPELPPIQAYWMDNPRLVEGGKDQTITNQYTEALYKRNPDAWLFGGVSFKYQEPPKDLVKMCKLAKQHIDVITTSGDRTGDAADISKVQTMRKAIGKSQMAIASGVDVNNVMEYMKYVNWFLVATRISIDEYNLDPILVKKMAKLIKGSDVK